MKQMIALWSMVMVHGLMAAGLSLKPQLTRSWARELASLREHRGRAEQSSNVVGAQPGYLARPATEAPQTRIYFITPPVWGQFSAPRARTVVRGERASRSIVNRTTALWSIWMVSSLILAGLGIRAHF